MARKKLFRVFFILILIGGLSALVWTVSKPFLTKSRAGFNQAQYDQIRSVTWYDGRPATESLTALKEALPNIKSYGFNTIWLVSSWAQFDPAPLATPRVYNDSRFTALKDTLQFLQDNDMKAILPLNYLGPGWAPKDIDACSWIENDTQYRAFESYVTEYLTRIRAYSNMVYIMVFTENATPCRLAEYWKPEIMDQTIPLFQNSLGSLPNRLPTDLRREFKIGYHDNQIITKDWGRGKSPIASPNPFDFLSMTGYDGRSWRNGDEISFATATDEAIKKFITVRRSFFTKLYPTVPLILGETGVTVCSGEDTQAKKLYTIVNTAIKAKMGINLWGWTHPVYQEEKCDTPANIGSALSLTNPQTGQPRKVLERIMPLISGIVNQPSPTPQTKYINSNNCKSINDLCKKHGGMMCELARKAGCR